MDNLTINIKSIGHSKKDNKAYATFFIWEGDEDKGYWSGTKNKDGAYGEYFVFIDEDTFNAIKNTGLKNCTIYEATAYQRGTRVLVDKIIV